MSEQGLAAAANGPVSEALGNMDERIGRLQSIVESLNQRLSNVLCAQPSCEAGACDRKAGGSPMEETLIVFNDRLDRAIGELESIYSRVQL